MNPMDVEDVTLGEVNRSVRRLEQAVQNISNQMAIALGPIGELRVHITNCQKDINELGVEVRANKDRTDKMEIRAAGAAGGITAIAFLVKFLIGK